ncbi:pentapeptide repeat-containing protein [Actinokineospora sp. 24-640]
MRELRADCGRCFGLCCVALPFPKSADFAVDKAGGTPCRNLLGDFTCGVHATLRQSGYTGCTVYDCFGAGQRLSQETFGGRDWRAPGVAGPMFAAFPVLRGLHELLWHVAEALELPEARPVHGELRRVRERVEAIAAGTPDELASVDVNGQRSLAVGPLRRAGELARAGVRGPDHSGADLVGRDLRARSLRGASLRGALLLGADLRGVDLHRADVTGADLRRADLRGADLSTTLFLTQSQLDAAVGDRATAVPAARTRPRHWH